jgi:hypothetical protein
VGVVVRTGSRLDVALTRGVGGTIRARGVATDGRLVFVSRDGVGPRSASLEHGRSLVVDGRRVLRSSAPVSAAMAWRQGDDALLAEVTAARPTDVAFALPGAGGTVTMRVPAGRHTVAVPAER